MITIPEQKYTKGRTSEHKQKENRNNEGQNNKRNKEGLPTAGRYGAGTSHISPALAYVRANCPHCITEFTLGDKLEDFSQKSSNGRAVKDCADAFVRKVGSLDDFTVLDFLPRLSSSGIEYVHKEEFYAMYLQFFGDDEKGSDKVLDDVFYFSRSNDDDKPNEMYNCVYDEKDGIGHISMSEIDARAYFSCYFVKG